MRLYNEILVVRARASVKLNIAKEVRVLASKLLESPDIEQRLKEYHLE